MMMKVCSRNVALQILLFFFILGFLVCVLNIGSYSPLSIFRSSSVADTHPWRPQLNQLDALQEYTSAYSSERDVDLRVIVIVYNRAKSLLRLLNSLNEALYFGDKVVLDVWIDRSKDKGTIDEETFSQARNFSFRHGAYHVHNHTVHVGIYGQWLRTWFPNNGSTEIAVVLEDDLTVSRYFYRWLKNVHSKYDSYKKINGFSLQGVSIKHNGAAGLLSAPKEHVIYLYSVLGTWGFSPSRDNWIQFQEWFNTVSKNSSFQPLVPGILPTDWYKSFMRTGRTEGMWSMWHIYYAWQNSEYTVYPNLPGHIGLTANWKEAGLHYTGGQAQSSDKLVTEWKAEYDTLPDMPVCLDISGKVTSKDIRNSR